MPIAEIKHIVRSAKTKVLPDIKELFKRKDKMDMVDSNVNTRAMDYFKCSKTFAADKDLAECFSLERGTRVIGQRLISVLRPSALKAEMKP
ncbi:hypothetical protein PI124_g570 [Phytophthora idaei]|nr:hypothetical protein PI125_g9881 [Phytophthora idaei]KAG3152321.1 hypothetical protein PI126_g10564 [Phytophthora idaei]KAG3254901.1 hypothetical protein PI124_g570 [Phytophthora idaei]